MNIVKYEVLKQFLLIKNAKNIRTLQPMSIFVQNIYLLQKNILLPYV